MIFSKCICISYILYKRIKALQGLFSIYILWTWLPNIYLVFKLRMRKDEITQSTNDFLHVRKITQRSECKNSCFATNQVFGVSAAYWFPYNQIKFVLNEHINNNSKDEKHFYNTI